jgi:WD40 repeat protein
MNTRARAVSKEGLYVHTLILATLLSMNAVTACDGGSVDPIEALTLEPNPNTEATTDGDGGVVVQAHTACIYDVAFSPDGAQIATCGLDDAVRIWDSRSGQYLRGFSNGRIVLAVSFSPDGRSLLVATIDHGIHMFDTATWKSSVVARTDGMPQAIVQSESGDSIAIGTDPIQLFRPTDFSQICVLRGHKLGGEALAFSSDGKTLVSGNADQKAKVWDVEKQALRFERQHDYWVDSVDVSRDGKQIAISSFRRAPGSQTYEIAIVNSTSGAIEGALMGETLRGHAHSSTQIRYSPDGLLLVSLMQGLHATDDVRDDDDVTDDVGSISVWDAKTEALIARRTSNQRPYRLCISRDSKRVAVTDVKGKLEIWKVASFIKENSVNKPGQAEPGVGADSR